MSTELRELSRKLMMNGKKLDELPLTIFHLARKIKRGSLILLGPTEIWTNKKKSEYIESIYLDYPLAWFYSEEIDKGKLLLKRGTERALAILQYLDNSLNLTGFKILPKLEKCSFDEIYQKNEWLYSRFTERIILMYVYSSKLSPEENDEAIKRSLWL